MKIFNVKILLEPLIGIHQQVHEGLPVSLRKEPLYIRILGNHGDQGTHLAFFGRYFL